jgi:hypothetical protein
MSMLGGDDWRPIPCRRIDRTVTRKGKHVIMITRPGSRLRAVMTSTSCTARSVSDTPSPSEIVMSCAAAAVERAAQSPKARTRARRNLI